MRISRRTFLRGAGGVSVALPLFSSLGCDSRSTLAARQASRSLTASGFPKRIIFVYKPNGTMPGWFPNGGNGADFDLTQSILAPLAPYKDKLLLLRGLDLQVHDEGPGEPHQQGMAYLTGRPLNTGNQVGGDGSLAGWGSGISIDQHIAAAVGGATKFASRQFGVQSTMFGGTEVRTVISYAGSDQPIANETNPQAAFDSIFSELGADPVGVEAVRVKRKSILDAVGRQYDALNPKLGTDDRAKLDQHLTLVRDIEQRLDSPGGVVGGSCQVPTVSTGGMNLNDPNNYGAIGQNQMDLLVMALACDLTRVATLQWSASTNNRPYPFLSYNGSPLTGDEHVTGHAPDSDTGAWARMRVINDWYALQFKYLLDRMAAIPEGDGTMLDNSCIVFGSEINQGNNHSHSDVPFLLAGGLGGAIPTGRIVDFPGVTFHNDLWVTLMNAMDVPGTTFGHPDFCTGPLSLG